MARASRPLLTSAEFQDLLDRLPRRAAAGYCAPLAVLAARDLIVEGITVTCGEGPAQPGLAPDDHRPALAPKPYRLSQWYDEAGDWKALNDHLEIDIHGAQSLTHIDTLNHFYWQGLNNTGDAPADLDRSLPSIDALAELSKGIVGRGVMIDVPGMLGHPIAPGAVITLDDLTDALALQDTVLRSGDILFISFGRSRPRRSDIPLGSEPVAGVSIECAEWIAAKQPAVIITDNGMDGFPTEVDGVPVPWHVVLLVALGIPLIDAAMLATLARTCSQLGRWEFFTAIAPLHVPYASGSPVNPIAIF